MGDALCRATHGIFFDELVLYRFHFWHHALPFYHFLKGSYEGESVGLDFDEGLTTHKGHHSILLYQFSFNSTSFEEDNL